MMKKNVFKVYGEDEMMILMENMSCYAFGFIILSAAYFSRFANNDCWNRRQCQLKCMVEGIPGMGECMFLRLYLRKIFKTGEHIKFIAVYIHQKEEKIPRPILS